MVVHYISKATHKIMNLVQLLTIIMQKNMVEQYTLMEKVKKIHLKPENSTKTMQIMVEQYYSIIMRKTQLLANIHSQRIMLLAGDQFTLKKNLKETLS